MNTAHRAARSRAQSGFTLIELLVVIIIIGVLAAIAVPTFMGQRDAAWRATVASDLTSAAIVIESFGASHGGDFASFPVSSASNGIPSSGGNVIVVTLSADSYTIKGTSPNLSGDADFQWYNRAGGGLQRWGSPAAP